MKKLCAGKPVEIAGVTLIPVEWMTISAQQESGHTWLQATKEVVAMLICEADKTHLLDVNGESLPLEYWLPKVEGLESAVQACQKD